MESTARTTTLDEQITLWRSYLRNRQTIHSVDIVELEDHLREQIDGLMTAGLAADEAFLVAVKRMGDLDTLSREFAREHSDRLWKQLVTVSADAGSASRSRTDAIVAFGCAVGAAALFKLPALFGVDARTNEMFYVRNVPLFVLSMLTGYFTWKRGLPSTRWRWLALAFVVAAAIMNSLPFTSGGSTEVLAALHQPIALWLVVGLAYAGTRWREVAGRMDFVRFSGELFIYFVLMGLGGGVLLAMSNLIFKAIGIDIEPLFETWILPCGASGAVLVAAWLVESKQSVIENMAPVLTRLFTPLFASALVIFLGALLWTGRGIGIDRDLLIGFDALLAVVLALLLYALSARDPQAPPGPFDVIQLVLVVAALITDLVALSAIAGRIDEFGVSPNRVAALGENLLLMANLGGSAIFSARFLTRRGSFGALERWQTNFLPLYALWAVVVVVLFPVLFGFV